MENSLIKYNPNHEKEGIKLYKQNMFYSILVDIMENPKLSLFFSKYFKSVDDIYLVLLYINLYKELTKYNISPYMKLYIIHNFINDTKIRGQIFSNIKKLC